MKKVKVQRYVSGKRPEYAPASSDEEMSDDEDFTRPQGAAPASPTHQKTLTDAELQDPRLRRLLASMQKHSQRYSDDEGYDEDHKEKESNEFDRSRMDDESMLKPTEDDEEMMTQRRRIAQSEIVEVSEDEEREKEETRPAMVWPSHRLADSDSESEDEMDEEELANRRLRLREKAMQKAQQEEEVSNILKLFFQF